MVVYERNIKETSGDFVLGNRECNSFFKNRTSSYNTKSMAHISANCTKIWFIDYSIPILRHFRIIVTEGSLFCYWKLLLSPTFIDKNVFYREDNLQPRLIFTNPNHDSHSVFNPIHSARPLHCGSVAGLDKVWI